MQFNLMILSIVLLIAVITDIRAGKIRNWLTLPAIAIGPIANYLQGGTQGLANSFAAIGIMIVIVAVLIGLNVFAGGDAKLLVAAGSLSGTSMIVGTLLYTGVAGGMLAIIYLIKRRQTAVVARQLAEAAVIKLTANVGTMEGVRTNIKIPYAVAIAAGCVAAYSFPL